MASSVSKPTVLLLGVDGGGTSTEAWLAEPGGKVLGQGRAGPSNAKAVGFQSSRQALDLAIQAAFHAGGLTPRPADIACLGLAGFDRPDDRKLLAGWASEAGWARRTVLANDGNLVVAAGTPEGWGIGVIAGTGSIAVGHLHGGVPPVLEVGGTLSEMKEVPIAWYSTHCVSWPAVQMDVSQCDQITIPSPAVFARARCQRTHADRHDDLLCGIQSRPTCVACSRRTGCRR